MTYSNRAAPADIAPPYGRARRAASGGAADATWTPVLLDTLDPGASNVSLVGGALVVAESGLYLICTKARFVDAAGGYRATRVSRSGSPVMPDYRPAPDASPVSPGCSDILSLAAGDVLALEVYQSSGAALDLQIGTLQYTWLSVARLGAVA